MRDTVPDEEMGENMNNYMRIMIYLRTKEDTNQTAGYLRLERKGGYLFFSLVLTGTVVPAGCPIYIVYDKEGRQQRYCVGYTSETENSEGRILLSQLPHRECETKVYGALIGTEESYLTGTVNSQFELPAWQQEAPVEEEIVQEQEISPEEETVQEQEISPEEETVQEQETPPEEETVQEQEISPEEETVQEQETPPEEETVQEQEAPPEEEIVQRQETPPEEETVQEPPIFEDDELVWCRRIHPAEISGMHPAEWYLVANSFLLQGYYNYHHLIYASDGKKIYVGVPGQYYRREIYMAKRFGFPIFKGRRKKSISIGDFGYWLREVRKDV